MKIAVVTVLAIILTACSAPAVRQAQQKELIEGVPICTNQKQCDAQWTAASSWVARNCGMKIQTTNESLIQTFNSIGSSTDTSCSVIRETVQSSRKAILINVRCANIFGCVPAAHEQAVSFNRFVREAGEPFESIAFGIDVDQVDSANIITTSQARAYGLKIKSVVPNSPASNAGIQVGDLLMAVDGERIRTTTELDEARSRLRGGDVPTLKVQRDGKETALQLKL
ncbi:PDZ domain-containing protein [Xanthomonas prunicola]|uniref:PDZ domain-containing protein n=1 Tax=Xanthomonas prunicola TaxID=2053930 RepID=UPI0021B3FD75|nr:PDZ domain-containing protein [Xanthomonas prunicola]UXA48503.1 PDZ domain-containing protein [Xanthomonas prunicola]